MAISATINKVSLNIANMDRHHYQLYELTVAQHPSETDYRFMIRLIAFALNANDHLSFTKGLCVNDEPEIWQKSLSDEIELWIDLGQVDEKRIRKACGRAGQVIIYTYNERKATVWWEQQADKLQRFDNLRVFHMYADIPDSMVSRTMQLQCNIQDNEVYLSDSNSELNITLETRK